MTITLTLQLKKYKIDSKLQEEIKNRLLSKRFSFKVIKSVMFDIDNHEKDILAVGYKNQKNETEDKWNQLNLIYIQYLLGTKHIRPLSHMAKSSIWIEEKNQRINKFYIGYKMNPNLNTSKAFREQVKLCLKNTFGTYNMAHISKILLKANTVVLELVMFYDNRKKYKENVQSVELCNIYNYKQICMY